MKKEDFDNAIAQINNSFTISKEKIGARSSFWKLLPKKLADISRKFESGEPISSIEIQEIRAKWLSEDPLIDENGNPFVFYIHDFSNSHWGKPDRVFHVAWCHTLDWMDKGGRKERYVKKTDLSNNDFRVDYGRGQKGTERLPACYNCKTKMQNKVHPQGLYYDRNNLDIVKFFQMYGKQDLINMDNPVYSVDYPQNWRNISLRLREEANWKCSKCYRDFSSNRGVLDVHHKNGNRSDVQRKNLVVLCRNCHTEQFAHGHMRTLFKSFDRDNTVTESPAQTSTLPISQSEMNKLENFLKQPEKYATGTMKASQKVKDVRHFYGLVKDKLSSAKQKEFSVAMETYENRLKA